MTKDIEKRNYIIILMKKYKINFSFVLVEKVSDEKYNQLCVSQNINITKGELGCCLSHMWCLNDIIQNNYENAMIFEDDIIFHKHFISDFLKIYTSTKLDFLLLGAHDYHFSSNNYKNVSSVNHLYYPEQNTKLYGAHANFYSLKAAKMMFKIRASLISFFDKEYGLLFEYFKDTSYVCYPNLAVTNISTSSLNHAKDFFTENENSYYTKCFIRFDFSQYHFIYLNIINKNCIPISQEDTYETYITKCLYVYFYNFEYIKKIKKRMSFDFFTIDDIRNIFFPMEKVNKLNRDEHEINKIFNNKKSNRPHLRFLSIHKNNTTPIVEKDLRNDEFTII